MEIKKDQKKSNKFFAIPNLLERVLFCFVIFLLALSFALFGGQSSRPAEAAAGINQQLNYQARLLDNAGAVVADGLYNIEFNIYQDGDGCVSGGSSPCSGTLKWTESRIQANRVTVKNGYFSVNLGSVTAFGTSVDWDQDTLWLSINVGGTTNTPTPTWDGEMTPFRRMAAVPYAFNAKQLGGLDASAFVKLAPSAVQVDSGTLSSIFINKTGASGNILELQKNANNVFVVGNDGGLSIAAGQGIDSVTAGALSFGGSTATSVEICNTASCDTINIGTNADADTITIGDSTDTALKLGKFTTANGVLYISATDGTVSQTAASTGAQCLQTSGAGTAPIWGACGSGSGVSAVGTIDSQTKSANGAVISGSDIIFQTADASNPGLVSTGTQTFAGDKTFTGAINFTPSGTNDVTFTTGTDSTVVFNASNDASADITTTADQNLIIAPSGTGGVLFVNDADSGVVVGAYAGAAPGVNMFTITDAGLRSTTDGVSGQLIDFGSSNASGSALRITPAFAGGATDTRVYNGIELDAFSPTNAAGTDTVNGIKIGNLTDPGATITSSALNLGSGWDTLISGTTAGTNIFSFTNASLTSAGALTVTSCSGCGGGGGAGQAANTSAAAKLGGGGGGGGAYNQLSLASSAIGSSVEVTIGGSGTGGTGVAGGNGNAGNPGGQTCFSTTTSCAGTMYLQSFGGGGGAATAVGNGGGGGGGTHAVGGNATTATGATGGAPVGGGAGVANSGGGGGGGTTAVASPAAVGVGGSFWGGGGGGGSSTTAASNSGGGAGSIRGGSGGGAGGGCAVTTCTIRAGGAGGLSGKPATAGSAGGSTIGQAGTAGANGGFLGGGGGGGGGGAAYGTSGSSTGGRGGDGGAGRVNITTIKGTGADLAEIYASKDKSIGPGDVVCLDATLRAGVKKCTNAYDKDAFGIVTTLPSLVMGNVEDDDAEPVMIALAGRVPLKVSVENGNIKAGDLLTPSSTPGYAMKATKAGQIVGQAMIDYEFIPNTDTERYATIAAFVKNDVANGSKLSDLIDGLDSGDTEPATPDVSKFALSHLVTQKDELASAPNLSEIITDRVVAGLEVITPRLLADSVETNSISSATGNDIDINLGETGKLDLNDSKGNANISFDSSGNATFKGTLTADKIKANQIEGLDIYVNNIGKLSDAPQSSVATEDSTTSDVEASNPSTTSADGLNIQAATVALDLNVNGTLFANGALKVTGPAEFLNTSVFYKLATFIDKTIFRNDVNFEKDVNIAGNITVSDNSAGTVKVLAGQSSIKVVFSKPYAKPPVVNVTPVGIITPKYGVIDVTENGFTVQIDPAQTTDTQFNWIAVQNN